MKVNYRKPFLERPYFGGSVSFVVSHIQGLSLKLMDENKIHVCRLCSLGFNFSYAYF